MVRRLSVDNPTKATVTISLDQDESLLARRKHETSQMVVGTFLSPIDLYRIFDGEELRNIVAGNPFGGHFSTEAERSYGSAWGADLDEVLRFGRYHKGRLGNELFVAQIQGEGRRFSNLGNEAFFLKPDAYDVPVNICNIGLGCSVDVMPQDVLRWWEVKGDQLVPTTWNALVAMAPHVATDPRKRDLWLGANLVVNDMRLTRTLLWYAEDREIHRIPDAKQQQEALWQHSPRTPLVTIKPNVLLKACQQQGYSRWQTSYYIAAQDAGVSSDNAFALLFRSTAKVTVQSPGFFAEPASVVVNKIIMWDPQTSDFDVYLYNKAKGAPPTDARRDPRRRRARTKPVVQYEDNPTRARWSPATQRRG
jgi:hypothetical protein